jgi:hypothetical protein
MTIPSPLLPPVTVGSSRLLGPSRHRIRPIHVIRLRFWSDPTAFLASTTIGLGNSKSVASARRRRPSGRHSAHGAAAWLTYCRSRPRSVAPSLICVALVYTGPQTS